MKLILTLSLLFSTIAVANENFPVYLRDPESISIGLGGPQMESLRIILRHYQEQFGKLEIREIHFIEVQDPKGTYTRGYVSGIFKVNGEVFSISFDNNTAPPTAEYFPLQRESGN